MNGKNRVNEEMGEIKKGPWKAEEDEVLINHVKKYGPRDWSSIRSKGLLQRTGKSCRLRWVNKLRPNLKNGVKFSAEEERIVIDLQAQFGNKWARIATYLPGRTDNDVKNFWSSRQKRLARILHTPSSSSSASSKSQRTNKHAHALCNVPPSTRDSKFSSLQEEETFPKSHSCSSSFMDQSEAFKMVQLPELTQRNSVNYEQSLLQPNLISSERKPCIETALSQLPLPLIPLQSDFTLALENQDSVSGGYQDREPLQTDLEWITPKHDYELLDSNYFDAFGQANFPELGNMQLPGLACLESESSSHVTVKKDNGNPVTSETMLDDLPMDMFDRIDPLPSPSNW